MPPPTSAGYALSLARTYHPQHGAWATVFIDADTFTRALTHRGSLVCDQNEAMTMALGIGFHDRVDPYAEVPEPHAEHDTWKVVLPGAGIPGGVYGLNTIALEPLTLKGTVPDDWREAAHDRDDRCHLFIMAGMRIESLAGGGLGVSLTGDRSRIIGMTVPVVTP